jgi:hypothetical protein
MINVIYSLLIYFHYNNTGVLTANHREIMHDGSIISIPDIKRVRGFSSLLDGFEKSRRESLNISRLVRGKNDKRDYIGLRRSDMRTVAKIVCLNKLQSEAALDGIIESHGKQNFILSEKKLSRLKVLLPCMGTRIDYALNQMNSVKETLESKSYFKSTEHFLDPNNLSDCAEHCHYYAFGLIDPSSVAIVGSEIGIYM